MKNGKSQSTPFRFPPRLPGKPSALLLRALRDLEATEQDPRYEIDMESWHRPSGDRCAVCLAGSVLAQGGADPAKDIWPEDLDGSTRAKLWALDYLRGGYLSDALAALRIDRAELDDVWPNLLEEFLYHDDRELWWAHMLDTVGILQAEGL